MVTAALALISDGLNDREAAESLGLARATVRDWRRSSERGVAPGGARCPRCWRPSQRRLNFDPDDYAELLGLYLGDGCISAFERTCALRISLDSKYVGIVRDARALLERCFPENRLHEVRVAGSGVLILHICSNHLPCLLPQHGPGRKHERPIILEPWQQTIVDGAPWRLLRGLVRSDGCVFVNRTGRYEYLSYDFTNHSQDILDLFASTCDDLGVRYRRYPLRIRVCRREAVAKMVEHVGLKA